VQPAAAATFTVVVAISSITAGVPDPFTVTALDQFGNIATGYTGTATFSSTDTQAVFTPPSHAFVAGDAGVFTGSVMFKTAGLQTVTANDRVTHVTGPSAAVTVRAAAAASFTVSVAVSPVTAGVADDFLVTAHDAFGNVATGYAGTATFTS